MTTSILHKIEKRFAWSFIGTVLAVLTGAFAVFTFVYEKEPRLTFEVIGNEPVLDVKEELTDLEVIYQGQDISNSGRSLSVILVRVTNRGEANILINDYDEKAPVSISLKNGNLVRASVPEASNDYLRNSIKTISTSDKIKIPPVILEPDEWFLVKILTLHSIDEKPFIKPQGKIAGQASISVSTSFSSEISENFWHKTFQGGPFVQATRLASYVMIFILIISVVLYCVINTSNFFTKTKRQRVTNSFKSFTDLELSSRDDFIFEQYLKSGQRGLEFIETATSHDYINKRIRLKREITKNEKQKMCDTANDLEQEILDENEMETLPDFIEKPFFLHDKMRELGLIEEIDGKWMMEPGRQKVLHKFIDYVRIKEWN